MAEENIHNLTDLLNFLNSSFTLCAVDLDEGVKKAFLFILYLVTFVLGLAGNLLVVWVNWQSRRRRSSINLYIFSMAVADLGVVLSLPFWMLQAMLDYTWLWGGFMCKFIHYFYFANMFSSIYFLTALSVDRYLSLTSSSVFWQQNQQKLRKGICIAICVISAIFPIPEVIHMQLVDIIDPECIFMAPFETYDEWALAVTLMTTILGFIIPFFIILVFNVMTACHLRKSRRPESSKHCRLIYAYILTFLLSWLPYHSTQIALILHGSYINLHCHAIAVLYFLYDIIDCISLFHCMANPILYNIFSKDFRGRFINAVVKYIPKDNKDGNANPAEQSTSTTDHSVVITAEPAVLTNVVRVSEDKVM
ncbi:G-protein coupled receptor 182 [Hyla sarda]|uniref:G-protein coupled receptor 182 n=1 Tax=Hyla sarda TaxID=327740 RepID=UPI0024C397A9|nr:G-protein coupled receptor 182 [Hyla sarda]XP_056416354.1 G-protein coupled receptor 182 [Hyla sarda]XP_056416355.1 G-protein coupled receptor 182 [Hyla sarda]XP_056416356.1 G-protein coupled receptor 182 [Hyla sarda]